MNPRKRTPSPVEIVLTEEDLAAIIRETRREPAVPDRPGAPGAPSPEAEPAFPNVPADRAWSLSAGSPGAVGDAIRTILEATTLGRGKRMGFPGGPHGSPR